MVQATCDLALRDCYSISHRSSVYFALAGISFTNCSRIAISLRHPVRRVARWSRTGVAGDRTFRYRFLLLLPATSPFIRYKPEEIPRFIVFLVAALFVWTLSAAQNRATESIRRARDDLKATVQELQRINEELQKESRERKQAEEALRQTRADLAHVNRVTTLGELTASLAHEVNQPIAAAVTNAKTCLRWLNRDHPDLEEARDAAMRIVNDGTRAAEIFSRTRSLFKKGATQRELVEDRKSVV